MEKMMDRCGLFGMFDNNGFHTSHLIYYGLFSMQHRGMEAAGICVNDNQGNFSYVKDEGLVTEVFDEMKLEKLQGTGGLGKILGSFEGIAKKALEKNSTETTWIPAGDHGDVLPTDVKNAKAAISADGKFTIVAFNVNSQTDGPKESSSIGPVGRSIGTLGNVQNALDELPGVSVTSGMENIKLTYNDAYVRDVKIDNATGKIISGTWHYKVNVDVKNLGVKVIGIPASIDTLTGIVDYTVKLG